MNLATREVSRDGEATNLTLREYELLHALLTEPKRVQELQKLVQEVWGKNHYGDSNLLDVYIRYLRKKIEKPGKPTLAHTVRAVEFILQEEAVEG